MNEALAGLTADPVTASAFSQVRYKVKHTAFIELNQKAVVESRYRDADFWGFRVLAVDGLKVRLPDTEEVRAAFGTIASSSGKNPQIQGEHPYALASVLYDVLNRIALDATLGRADAYEVDLAIGHLAHTGPTDVLIMDRNYRTSAAPSAPPANLGQSLAGFPASTEKALLLKQIRLT